MGMIVCRLIRRGYKKMYCRECDGCDCLQVDTSWLQVMGVIVCRLIRRGYKKPLDKDSLWNLNRQDTSAVIVPEFERQWRRQCVKVNRYDERKWRSQCVKVNRYDERQFDILLLPKEGRSCDLCLHGYCCIEIHLLSQIMSSDWSRKYTYYNSKSTTKPRYRKSSRGGSYDVMQPLKDVDPEVKVKDSSSTCSEREMKQPSLVRSLAATFWRVFLFGSFLKLVQDILIFVNPQILK